ncbi:MAG: hypothetical protein H7Z18_11630 [Methylophilaceae bacterium]|nr:hypothetical protein [Methylophilaceae bacterium]
MKGDAGAKFLMHRDAAFITKIISAGDGVLFGIDLQSDVKEATSIKLHHSMS